LPARWPRHRARQLQQRAQPIAREFAPPEAWGAQAACKVDPRPRSPRWTARWREEGGFLWRVPSRRLLRVPASRGRRHGVETSRGKRLAAEQAPQGKPCAATRAMALNGLQRVMRTRGIKAARPAEKRRECGLIGAHGQEAEGNAQVFSRGVSNDVPRGAPPPGDAVAVKALRRRPRSSSLRARNSAVATEARG